MLVLVAGLFTMLKQEGVRGLWRGNSAAVLRIIPSMAIQLVCFSYLKDFATRPLESSEEGEHAYPKPLSAGMTMVIAAAAGVSSQAATHPLDLLYDVVLRGILSCLEQQPKNQYSFIVGTGRKCADYRRFRTRIRTKSRSLH